VIKEAGGGIVVVNMHYRLGIFGKSYFLISLRCVYDVLFVIGFLAGSEVKAKGALNAGLRRFPSVTCLLLM
jgi:hypothetical protein